MRYADPTRCPDCREHLPPEVPVCPTCQLLVRHPTAAVLFGSLLRADELLGDLRTASDAFHAPAPVAAGAGLRSAADAPSLGSPLTAPAPAPLPVSPHLGTDASATAVPAAPGTGVTVSSVPRILLGLGAFCLLTAGVIFLAVSWSRLGVGGRTAVLGAFTGASLGASLLLHRHGLRIAAESLSTVGLGMLGLDVLGAGAAGWLGTSDAATAATAGAVLAGSGTALGLLRVADQRRLVAPQVIAGLGLALAYLGTIAATSHDLLAAHALTGLAAAVAVLGLRSGEAVLVRGATAAAVLAWSGGALGALARGLADPTLRELWLDGAGWSLVVSGLWLLAPGLVRRERRLTLVGATGTAALLTAVATLPGIDSDPRTVGLLALGVTALWTLALAVLPRELRVVAVAPAGAGALLLAGHAITTAGVALARWSTVASEQAVSRSFTLRLSGPEAPTDPLQLVPSLLLLTALVALLGRDGSGLRLRPWLRTSGVVAGVGVAVTLASYDVPLAAVVGVLLLTAIGCLDVVVRSTGSDGSAAGACGLVLLALATSAALPSAPLTALAAGVAATGAVLLAVLRTDALRSGAGLAAAPLVGVTLGALLTSADAGASWIAVPVLLGVGLLALALPRAEVELSAAVTASLALAVSLPAVDHPAALAALWLSVAGALCVATALLTPTRRPLAGVGGALMLLATWIRLADLSVGAPEAYTLPLAVVLLGLGVHRLRRSPEASTTATLLPGLLAGTVPSLLWALADPVSLRALCLGAACLGLVVVGAGLRWSAPLLTGGTAGTLLVLREIGPYAAEIPQWVWIALAGVVLTGLGITWERRLLEVRRTAGFLGRLR